MVFKAHKRLVSIAALAFFIQMSISMLVISKNPGTPFDEAAHLDYVVKISKGHLPSVNEKYGQDVLEWMACATPRGEAWAGLEPCGSTRYSPGLAPFAGQSSASGYVPTYYAITAVPYEFCDRLTSLTPINCGRIANSMWLNLAAAASSILMLMLGASRLTSIVGGVGLTSLPAVLLQGTTVNSDAAAQTLAPILVITAILLSRSNKSKFFTFVVFATTVIAALTIKQTLITSTAFATILLWYWTLLKSKRLDFKYAAGLFGVYVFSVFASYALLVLQPAFRGLGGSDNMKEFLLQPFETLPGSLSYAVYNSLSPFTTLVWTPLAQPWMPVVGFLVAVVIWALLFSAKSSKEQEFPHMSELVLLSSFLIAFVGPVLLAITSWYMLGSAPVQSRYYMSYATLIGAIGLATTKSKPLRFFAIGLLSLSTLSTVISVLRY